MALTEKADSLPTAAVEAQPSYRAMLENAADVIWQMDRELRFTLVNAAVEWQTGYRPAELIGRPVATLFRAATALLTRAQERAGPGRPAAPETDALLYEAEMLRKDGRTVAVEVNSRPLRDAAGEIEGYVAVARDIATRKRVRDELVHTNTLLQEKLHEIQRLELQLREQAVRDGLTGLYNRRHFDETLTREIARAQRLKQPLAVVMLDIDHFKSINDKFGHLAGDEVLRSLARLLLRDTRTQDVVCRYGGEEFVALLPGSRLEAAASRAEQWRAAFAATAAAVEGGEPVRATISLGVAVYPEHAVDGAELLQRADTAMYRAKNQGRNQVVVFEAAMV